MVGQAGHVQRREQRREFPFALKNFNNALVAFGNQDAINDVNDTIRSDQRLQSQGAIGGHDLNRENSPCISYSSPIESI